MYSKCKNMLRRNIIALIFLMLLCSCINKNDKSTIESKWYNGENSLVYDFFSEDSLRFHIQDGYLIKGSYNILSKNDSLVLFLNLSGDTMAIGMKYNIDSAYLYFYNYKYNGNIDEIVFLRRDTSLAIIPKNRKVKQKIIIEDNFIGDAFINYNSTGGVKKAIEDNVNQVYLPYTGLLKTRCNIDPFELEKNEIVFEKKESKLTIPSFCSLKFNDINKVSLLGYHKDSVCVCIYGFNQMGRSSINKEIFHEKIYGNVLMFRVDTLSNLLLKKGGF